MSEFSCLLRIDEMPPEGRNVALEAGEAERAAIARRLGLARLETLKADLDASPLPGGGLELSGRLTAVVEQTCVVSLEPLVSEIVRPLRLRFLPPEAFRAHEAALEAASAGVDGDLDDIDVEPLEGDTLDLAELILQELSLALDPYPRKEGAVLEGAGAAEANEGEPTRRPFAALGEMIGKRG